MQKNEQSKDINFTLFIFCKLKMRVLSVNAASASIDFPDNFVFARVNVRRARHTRIETSQGSQ